MHDLDRTLTELNNESSNEYGYEFGESEFETSAENWGETLNEADEMELATELLSVGSEAELDHFLGGLLRTAGKFLKSKTGQALGGMLKAAAKTALPVIGNAIAPGIGGMVASAASDAFGLEMEGLSAEDAEWEAAKSFVRFADAAIKQASSAHPSVPPQAAARTALIQAAKQFAPGLLRETGSPHHPRAQPASPAHHGSGASGRWIRRGNKIILLGV